MAARRLWAVALGCLLCWGAAAPARADVYVVDRIVAVVGSKPILLSTLRRRARPFLATMRRSVTGTGERLIARARIYREMLTQLVDEELIGQAARQAQIQVDRAEVDRALDLVAKQNGLTRRELLAQVEQHGMTETEYRDELERQILEGKVLMQTVKSQLAMVQERDLRALYERLRKEDPGQVPSFEAARERLAERLRAEQLQEAKRRWLERLRRNTYVEVRLAP